MRPENLGILKISTHLRQCQHRSKHPWADLWVKKAQHCCALAEKSVINVI
jgi:hypothetical protein